LVLLEKCWEEEMKTNELNEACKKKCKCRKVHWILGLALFLFVNVVVLDVIPTNMYLNDLREQITGTRVSLNMMTDLCSAFDKASEEDKIQNGFHTKFNEYSQRYIENFAQLVTMGDQLHRQGPKINDALTHFDVVNNKIVSEITKTNACPTPLPTQDQLWEAEGNALKAFPNSLPEYVTFYTGKFFRMLFASDEHRKK